MTTITLTRGYSTIVDDADFIEVGDIKWHACGVEGNIYAAIGGTLNGKRARFKLHRVLMGVAPGVKVDHQNGDTLDNRRQNLRVATSQQNSRNMRKWKLSSSSRWKGVCWHSRDHKWQVNIKPDAGSAQITVGSFSSELEAADAYDAAARRHHGEFAKLNFPD